MAEDVSNKQIEGLSWLSMILVGFGTTTLTAALNGYGAAGEASGATVAGFGLGAVFTLGGLFVAFYRGQLKGTKIGIAIDENLTPERAAVAAALLARVKVVEDAEGKLKLVTE